jgi:hypothetical protein
LLPPGWTQQYDSKSQRPYFFNTFTQQTSWDPPAAASFVEPVIDSLPDGWKKGIDPSGKVYFINDRLRLVQVLTAYGSFYQQQHITYFRRVKGPVHQRSKCMLLLFNRLW